MSPNIQVDGEVYRLLEFARKITGLSYSDIIKRAAEVKRDEHLSEAESLRGLADLSTGPLPVASTEPRADVRHGQAGVTVVVPDTRIKVQNEVTEALETPSPSEVTVDPAEVTEGDASEVSRRVGKPTVVKLRAMVQSGFLPGGTDLKYEMRGQVYEFKVAKDGTILYGRKKYATPGEAFEAAHGGRGMRVWDRMTNHQGVSLRELLDEYEASLEV